MASTATIILTGIVYLSHLPEATPPVLKAVVTKSDTDRVSTRGGAIPGHIAFLQIDQDDVLDPDTNAGQRKYNVKATLPNKEKVYVYFLRGETISFSGYSDTKLEMVEVAPDDKVLASFDDILKLEDFCPTCRPLPTAEFDRPDPKRVGGRLDITAGKVVAKGLSPCEQGWHFDAEFGYPAYHHKKMPREVEIELTVPTQLQLKTTAMPGVPASDAPDSVITFKAGKKVRVTIGSATAEDVLKLGAHHAMDRTDHHFELFYYLLERSNAAKHPLPVADPACTVLHRPSGIDCPPVQQ